MNGYGVAPLKSAVEKILGEQDQVILQPNSIYGDKGKKAYQKEKKIAYGEEENRQQSSGKDIGIMVKVLTPNLSTPPFPL